MFWTIKQTKSEKIYFTRLVRYYIVKNSDPQINLEFLKDFMRLSCIEEVSKAMSDNKDSSTI